MRRMANLGGLALLLAAMIISLPPAADEIDFFERVLDDIHGPRHAQVVDLDEDGDNDVVVCGFEDADIFW